MTGREVRFALLCEGSSDQALAAHLRILLEQLPVGGALEQVPAWRFLERQVSAFVHG